MSPTPDSGSPYCLGFPRVSGDEPLTAKSSMLTARFSPRERG